MVDAGAVLGGEFREVVLFSLVSSGVGGKEKGGKGKETSTL